MFYAIMIVFGAVGKAITLFIKFCAGLHQKGRLIPLFVITVGTLSVQHLWNFENTNIGYKTLAVAVGLITAIIAVVLLVRQHNKDNPDKPLEIGMTGRLNRPRKNSDNIKCMESSTPHGVIFGKVGKKYITKPESADGHVLVCGGVGSGKTSCVAIPTLRVWSNSVFAIDIKGELHEQSKDHRPNIKVFNPLDVHACGYNPFYCLQTSINPTQAARAIAQSLIPLPPDTKEPFWIESGQNILTGAILHSYQNYSFVNTLKAIQNSNPQRIINIISQSENEKARLCVNSYIGMADNTLSGIFSELSRNIVPLVTDDEIISALTRDKTITPDDLEYGNDIYIQIPEHLLKQWKPLLTLIVSQFLTHFEQRSESNAQPILFLLDEFPRLGKVNAMLDGLATLRSKKICICPIVQSLAQLDMIYGQNERKVIADTCSYKAILGATDADTQEYFSRLVGTYDKQTKSHGTSTSPFGLSGGTSTNTHETEKRVIKPEEFGRLDDIVLLTPHGMGRVGKVPYYLD